MVWIQLLAVAAPGVVTFAAVFWGAVLASRRHRYASHVDRLKTDAIDVLERWLNEIETGFSVHQIGFYTQPEGHNEALQGFQRQHYWDLPEIFHRPWDARDRHAVQLAAQHWPRAASWDIIISLGQITYKAIGVLHHALVHMWDDARGKLPSQPSHMDGDLNLMATSPGTWARALLGDILYQLQNMDAEGLFHVHQEFEGKRFGVHCCGTLVAVFPDESAANEAAKQAAAGLTRWSGPEAAKTIHQSGNALERMAEALHEDVLAGMYEAAATGWCTSCLSIAPKWQRWALAWDTFWFVGRHQGMRSAFRAARHSFVHGREPMHGGENYDDAVSEDADVILRESASNA